MNAFGLSGTEEFGPSGTAGSDDQEPGSLPDPQECWLSTPLNYANTESSGFLLTPMRAGMDFALATQKLTQHAAMRDPCDDDRLTHVTLMWLKGRREDWLKFGKPVASGIVDRRQRIESYSEGQCFGLVCWAANDYGTVRSAFYIVRAVGTGKQVVPVPQVDPGGDLLLSVHGWPKVAQVFRLIDTIEASGVDPCDVAPDHWQHIHNRLAARELPRGYSAERHRAWLARKALTS